MERRVSLITAKSKIEKIGYEKFLTSGIKEIGEFVDWLNREIKDCEIVDISSALGSLSKDSALTNFSTWKIEADVNNDSFRKIVIDDKNNNTVFEISIRTDYTSAMSPVSTGYTLTVYYEPKRNGKEVEIYCKKVDSDSSPQTLLKESFWIIEEYMKKHFITE